MQHLETERIAAFDHDEPSSEELAHLAACTVCRTERNAFSALNQRSMHMGDAPVFPPAPRLTNWESLSTRLRAEGLIAGEVPTAVVPTRNVTQPIAMESWWQRAKPRNHSEFLRAIAAVLVFAVTGAGVNQMRNDRAASTAAVGGVSAASIDLGLGLGNTGFASLDEATKALAQTERQIDRITTWITSNDPSATKSALLRKRLAALDRMIAAAYAESQTAPKDPVLDHYFHSAKAARELTLKQLGGALPVGRSLERF
ncbi:MAG: hypothetical protein ABI120_19465 [Gemmatimonadaceae bacterium]